MEIITIAFKDENDELIYYKKYFDNDKNGNENERWFGFKGDTL
jgi:hypothetical protein